MDAGLKAKWVEALRSGAFKQLRNKLTYDGSFCCLGVLNQVRNVPQSYVDFPRIVGDWELLARMNDEQGKSFSEIADYIEKNL